MLMYLFGKGQIKMLRRNMTKWTLLFAIPLLVACTQNRFPNLKVAGKPVTNYKYYKYYDGELKVLERADNMGATHLVWQYNYPIGSSGAAYRCDE
jgi:hypothetical protein